MDVFVGKICRAYVSRGNAFQPAEQWKLFEKRAGNDRFANTGSAGKRDKFYFLIAGCHRMFV